MYRNYYESGFSSIYLGIPIFFHVCDRKLKIRKKVHFSTWVRQIKIKLQQNYSGVSKLNENCMKVGYCFLFLNGVVYMFKI